jgi:hypothetical protein
VKPALSTHVIIRAHSAFVFALTSSPSEHIREHEQEMAFQSKFPSGSNWGPKEIDTVRFALEPIEQDFATFECDVTRSSANLRILARLADVFAIPVESLQNDDVTAPFKEHTVFYDRLAEVLKPEALPDTPLIPLTRSEIRYNTSSPFTAEGQPKTPTAVPSDFGSPESSPAAGASKRKIRTQSTTTPPSRKLGPAMSTGQERVTTASGLGYMADESLPALAEGEHRVSLEKPFRTSHGSSSQFHPACDDDRTSSKSEQEPSSSSSQIITRAGQTIVGKAKVCAESQRNAWQVLVSEGKT